MSRWADDAPKSEGGDIIGSKGFEATQAAARGHGPRVRQWSFCGSVSFRSSRLSNLIERLSPPTRSWTNCIGACSPSPKPRNGHTEYKQLSTSPCSAGSTNGSAITPSKSDDASPSSKPDNSRSPRSPSLTSVLEDHGYSANVSGSRLSYLADLELTRQRDRHAHVISNRVRRFAGLRLSFDRRFSRRAAGCGGCRDAHHFGASAPAKGPHSVRDRASSDQPEPMRTKEGSPAAYGRSSPAAHVRS